MRELIHITYNTHSTALAAAGRFSEAYLFRDLSSIYQDSLINTFTKNQLDVFNYQQTRSELALLRKEREVEQIQTQNQQYLIYGLTSISLLTALLAYVFNQSRKEKAKANESLEQKNTEISAQRTELDELNKVKDRMLAIISHDFRTPLISLQNIIVMVEEKMITAEELKKVIPAISLEMQGAKSLLENLLNWARSHMHGDFVKPSRLVLHHIVDAQVAGFKKQLSDKNIEVINDVDEDIVALADSNLISLVIRNILGNSLKFCDMNGEIRVTAENDNKKVVCCVSDNGVGIPPEKLETLFNKAIISSQGTSGEKGSGIGLTLCRDFIELTGGRIWAESEEGIGSKFFISMPGTGGTKLEKEEFIEVDNKI
ncbi:MAG: HAMP domain-containing sensor histidine kinase [Bacteroidetes bacterium]|nr:HAMP domain-containing sensor histidine kinase [Bacteroidota bacterium]MDA1119936.1 HAMP domain-containing sensor histidine kinase [Bacteroidota bacterium]